MSFELSSPSASSPAQSYTPNIVGFGAEANVLFSYAMITSDLMYIIGSFNSGVPELIDIEIPLPEGYEVASIGGRQGINSGLYAATATAYFNLSATPGDAFLNCYLGTQILTGGDFAVNGERIEIYAIVPVVAV